MSTASDQLRSARAARLPLAESVVALEEPDEPMVLPEPAVEPVLPLVDGDVALDEDDVPPEAVEPVEPVEPLVLLEPVLGEAPIVEEPLPVLPVVAEPLPAGVPVAPIGVFCVLRWPAPVAASLFGLGLGGVLWATAVPTTATAARPASRDFRYMGKLLFDLG